LSEKDLGLFPYANWLINDFLNLAYYFLGPTWGMAQHGVALFTLRLGLLNVESASRFKAQDAVPRSWENLEHLISGYNANPRKGK